MDLNPSSKKIVGNEHTDRISELPDPILGKILSYLPTRNAVATSLLSTRWKNLFPFAVPLTRLDLDDSNVTRSFTDIFIEFMDKLLNVSLRDVKCVETVVLYIVHDYEEDEFVSWVSALMRLKVRYLKLIFEVNCLENFLRSLHGCTTLVELEVGDDGLQLCVPQEFILPNLKRLALYKLQLDAEGEELQKLLDGCPVLSELKINGCDLEVLEALYIRHPLINKLFIDGSESEEDKGKVVIDAPNLEVFALQGQFVAEYVWRRNTKQLHSVCLDCDYRGFERRSNSHRLAKLIKACSSTIRLRLPGRSTEDLCLLSSVTLPMFPNLTSLALGRMGTQGRRTLAQFLNNAPNLTMLTFEEELDFLFYPGQAKSPLPSLELRIKKIEVWEFEWRPNEIELIEYFLKNGKLLEELIVHYPPYKNKSDLDKLSLLPRRSEACQVLFKDKTSRVRPCYSVESWFGAAHA